MDNLKQEVVVFIVGSVSLVGVFGWYNIYVNYLNKVYQWCLTKRLRFDVLG